MEPKLPPELEKTIFLYAYENNPKDIENLIFVAHRVHEWLCSRAFKVTVLLPGHRFPLKRLTLAKFLWYGKYIHHLAVDMTLLKYFQEEGLEEYVFGFRRTILRRLLSDVITACPNLLNLWVFTEELTYGNNFFPVFSPPITRLAIRLSILLGQLPLDAKESKPIFPSITHIQSFGNLFELQKEDSQSHLLSIHFPNLTHLALPTENAAQQKEGLRLTLERCKKLESVVLLYRAWETRPPMVDSRTVGLRIDAIGPWKAHAKGGGLDLWEMGDLNREVPKLRRNRRV